MRPRHGLTLGWLAIAACAHGRGEPVSAPGELAYKVTRPSTPRALDVEVLRVSDGPAAFSFSIPGGVDRVRAELQDGTQVELSVPSTGELDVPNGWAALRYRFSLDDLQRAFGADLSRGLASEGDLLLPGGAWLLRPREAHPGLTASIQGPADELLLPWERPTDGRWRVSSQALIDSGFAGFGGRRCYLPVGGGKVEVALIGAPHPLGDAAICQWLRRSAEEVRRVRDPVPFERVTIFVVPVPSNEASPFGRMSPSAPRSFAFLVGTEATTEDFDKDWVALHELLHLAEPTFEPKQTWLSEGLATYLTEVVRARSGRQDAIHAWLELLDGFDVGAVEAEGMRMEEVTRETSGGRRRAETWTGVVFTLALDVALRGGSRGRTSLDAVLAALGPGPVSLAQFGAAVDAAAGKPVFDALLAAHRAARAFFPVEALLEQLGVRRHLGQVTLQPAPLAATRDALMLKLPNP